MRPATRLLKYTPSIKFVGGPHKLASHGAAAHPCANGVVPLSFSAGAAATNQSPIEAGEGEWFSRAELPLRFQYKLPKQAEGEDIESGGADIVW